MTKAEKLISQFQAVRDYSLWMCSNLQVDDFGLQAEPFTSPAKWHLAHTTWFFETFILKPFSPGYTVFHSDFEYLFNSYYNAVGQQFPRPKRHLLSRPTLEQVYAYRDHVTDAMCRLLDRTADSDADEICARTILGLHHEQQHQELFFTDIKYCFFQNPLMPAVLNEEMLGAMPMLKLQQEGGGDFQESECSEKEQHSPWIDYTAGVASLGREALGGGELSHAGFEGFAFDNESPRHPVYLQDYRLAAHLVTNAEFQAFIDDGGYQRPELWLSDGWATVQSKAWKAPLYWFDRDGRACEFGLFGVGVREPDSPVIHISAYEAEAYAAWAGARLPSEAEWEHAALVGRANQQSPEFRPQSAARDSRGFQQGFDSCWQWTGSAYRPYPGYIPEAGALGEYNGKFMSNQWVLRGASCVTSVGHARPTYRNFFYPEDRWQFSGIRLAR